MWITLFILRITLWHGNELGVLSFIIWMTKQQMIPVLLLRLNDETGNDYCFAIRMTKHETFLFRSLNDEIWIISCFVIWITKQDSCFVIQMTKHKTFYVSLFKWRNTNNETGTNFRLQCSAGSVGSKYISRICWRITKRASTQYTP